MIVWIVILGVVGLYSGTCLVAGFGPAGTLDSFEPHSRLTCRRFVQPALTLESAYRAAVSHTPGMRVVDERPGALLVDSRPTSRILGGNYGMVIRLVFNDDGRESTVCADVRYKVPWSLTNHEAAVHHAERSLRMNAKRGGVEELV